MSAHGGEGHRSEPVEEQQQPRLEVSGATVRFGDAMALDGVDLAVPPGQVVAVLGPSGSGKSTLLRAIAGLQRLDAGRVVLDGRDVTAVPPHRRGIGLMFQDHALFPHRDVAGNVAFGLRMQGRPRAEIERRVGELLALVGLPGLATREVQSLSGGEQQRVALARALAPEPRVLLLDEPLGALDRALRDRLVAELQTLFASIGQTAVAVTHDQAEAFALAERIVLLDHGEVVGAGRPAEVWQDPQRVVAARLLGFTNIAAATPDRGGIDTPWGPVAAPWRAGTTHVLVRPGAVVLDPGATSVATVRSRRFAGSRTVVELATGGTAPLQAEIPTAGAPEPGTTVRYRIDPAGVALLGP